MVNSQKPTKAELKEDQFLEWIIRAADYLKERMQFVIGGSVAVVLAIAIVSWVRTAAETDRATATKVLGEALTADDSGNPERAIQLAETLVSDHRGTPAAAQGVIFLANRYFRQGRLSEAQQYYESYLDEYGDVDVLVFAATTGVAACFESQGQYAKAAKRYESYAEQHAGSQQSSLALMDASRCYAMAGDAEARRQALARVARDYPRSPLANKARERLRAL